MCGTAGPLRVAAPFVGLLLVLAAAAGGAQTSTADFITGDTAQAWEKWLAAMQTVLDRDEDKTEEAFGALLALEPSPLRVALLAEHTVRRTAAGGAVLLLEQDHEAGDLGENGRRVWELLETGREQRNEADDGFYFCQLGRFDVAEANFRALLEAGPDPVALLEFTDRVSKRREILIQLIDNQTVGDSVRELLRLLDRGELLIKADPVRIKENLERLGGPPRAFENAVDALKDSGEYAIPFIVQYLRDRAKHDLMPAILRCLPMIDRPALNPLVMALRIEDDATKRHIIEALGKIGYAQSVPYLLALRDDPETPAEVRETAAEALAKLSARGVDEAQEVPVADAFFALAEAYYADTPSLAADTRLDTANVWYWRDDLLQNIEVPTMIFNEIMTMRCCEEALRLEPDRADAVALWLAANFRREAQLALSEVDHTRPDNYPAGVYFAQVAGPEKCLRTLARALDAGDPAVALGAIEALRRTAGPASLVAGEGGRLPLAEALSFPNRMVRIQAGITLGRGNPTRPFANSQNLMPVLSEALMLHGGALNALVVDPDQEAANKVAATLREQGFEVLTDASLYPGLQKVRDQFPGLDVIYLASDIQDPGLMEGLAALRSEFRFASTPVILITRLGTTEMVRELARGDYRLGQVGADPSSGQLAKSFALVSKAVGAQPIRPETGTVLAKEAAEVLRRLAETNNPVFDIAPAEPALLAALATEDEELRLTVVEVLGYLGTSQAQEAVARIALDPAEPEATRVKMFTALATAAKRRGNLLGEETVAQVLKTAETDENLTIREAASRALGALDVPGAPGSEIIRHQYRG